MVETICEWDEGPQVSLIRDDKFIVFHQVRHLQNSGIGSQGVRYHATHWTVTPREAGEFRITRASFTGLPDDAILPDLTVNVSDPMHPPIGYKLIVAHQIAPDAKTVACRMRLMNRTSVPQSVFRVGVKDVSLALEAVEDSRYSVVYAERASPMRAERLLVLRPQCAIEFDLAKIVLEGGAQIGQMLSGRHVVTASWNEHRNPPIQEAVFAVSKELGSPPPETSPDASEYPLAVILDRCLQYWHPGDPVMLTVHLKNAGEWPIGLRNAFAPYQAVFTLDAACTPSRRKMKGFPSTLATLGSDAPDDLLLLQPGESLSVTFDAKDQFFGQPCLATVTYCGTLKLYPPDREPQHTSQDRWKPNEACVSLVHGTPSGNKATPDDAYGFRRRAEAYLYDNELDRAVADFNRSIALDPLSDSAYLLRGWVWARKGASAQAVSDFTVAIRLNWHQITQVYYALHQLDPRDASLEALIRSTAISHVSELETVSGRAVGAGGGPGEFYTVSLILAEYLGEDDFLGMLKSDAPMVRAMGLICLARADKIKHRSAIEALYTDEAEVEYNPMGCIIGRTTLGELARGLLNDRELTKCWLPHGKPMP